MRVGGGLALPCELDEPKEGRVAWRLHRRTEPADFTAMNEALELTLHPAAQALFGGWFSRPVPCLYKGLRLEFVLPRTRRISTCSRRTSSATC